jgi:hypothetical protein
MASTHILAVGRIEHGEIEMDIAMLPWVDDNEYIAPKGLPPLQQLIDEAADTEDYIWDVEDRNIWRKGQW